MPTTAQNHLSALLLLVSMAEQEHNRASVSALVDAALLVISHMLVTCAESPELAHIPLVRQRLELALRAF